MSVTQATPSAGDEVFVDRPFRGVVEGEVLYRTPTMCAILPLEEGGVIEASPDRVMPAGEGYAIRPLSKDSS